MLYTSQNYITVIPDFLGYKDSNVHPYLLYPNQTISYAGFVLNDAYKHISAVYPDIGRLTVYSVGYSDGGTYSLWMSAC